LRRLHRWLGLTVVLFVLLLSATGIALNHSSDWGLDQRFVRWNWAHSILGIRVPEVAASFTDDGHRVTQLGRRIYFDTSEISQEVESLAGFVVLDAFAVIATADAVLLLQVDGKFVQRLDLSADGATPVRRIGLLHGQPVIEADGYFIGDAEVTHFEPWPAADEADVAWSVASAPAPAEIGLLEDLYRGRSLTVERLLVEVHSGRILATAGPVMLDVVAVGLVVLSLSGVVAGLSRGGRKNGDRP